MAVQVPSRLAGRIASELATAVGVPQEFVTRVSVETYQHLRAAGTHRAPLTILPRHMGLAEFSDIGRYAEDLNLFRDWVVGKKVPEAIALWLGRMVVWSSRRSRRARPDEEAQQILQIKDWFNKRGFNPDLQENPELRGSPPAPAHVILDLDEGTEKERRLAFEVIDSANQQPSGGHYLRWSEEGAKPVFLIQLQSRYIREGKLDDVLENAMAQTEEDALRISREHVSAQVGLFAPRVLRDEWRLSRSS